MLREFRDLFPDGGACVERKFTESAARLAVLDARMLQLRANETGIPFLARASESRYCHQSLRSGLLIAVEDEMDQAAGDAGKFHRHFASAFGGCRGSENSNWSDLTSTRKTPKSRGIFVRSLTERWPYVDDKT